MSRRMRCSREELLATRDNGNRLDDIAPACGPDHLQRLSLLKTFLLKVTGEKPLERVISRAGSAIP